MKLSALRDSPRVRAVAIPTYRWAARAFFHGPPPRVLANSVPKAGTHLVAQLLRNLPDMHFAGRHHVMGDFRRSCPDAPSRVFDWDRIRRVLASIKDGQYMTAHFPPLPTLLSMLADLGFKTVCIIRDPRDIVVSNALFIPRVRRHDLYARFHAEFRTPEEQIMACITGFPPNELGRGLESIGDRLRKFQPWREHSRAYTTRFEDLVGPRGGGSNDLQIQEVMRIGAHVGRPLQPSRAQEIAERTWTSQSSTFRRGVQGEWRTHFTEEHIEAFKATAGAELIAEGYERNADW
jgi:hypothetical protein